MQKPAIPIWIGGHSKQALRRAPARFGDGWHPIGGVPTIPLEPEDVAADIVDCDASMPKKPGAIRKRSASRSKGSLFDREKQIIAGKPAAVYGQRRRDRRQTSATIATVGVDTMIFDVRRPSIAETLERMEWMAKDVFPKV